MKNRISGRKTRKGLLFLSLLGLLLLGLPKEVHAQAKRAEPGELYALSAVLMDGATGRVLYEKNGEEIRPMASTTKIMTCILVLEQGNLEEEAVTSAYAASMPKVHLGAREGEAFLVRDLLYSLMLESHNDSAVILAEHVGGSVQGFADRMNEKAAQIGCENTWFITPNGLDASQEIGGKERKHSTTAADLARILRYCIFQSPAREEFLNITRTASYTFSDVSGERSFSCVNHNAFLQMMEGALTGKTGFTSQAGYCYTGALESQGRTFIVALLGCGWPDNKNYKWSDTRKLMEYGMEYYQPRELTGEEPAEASQSLPVENGQSRKLGEEAYVEIKREPGEAFSMLLAPWEEATVRYQGERGLKAPVEKGQKVGEVLYLVQGQVWKREEVRTEAAVPCIDFSWCLRRTIEKMPLGTAG